ncbi:V-type ATP synthase subunit B [Meiothermus ruber]|jgi:V/A-type H+-transporting ATPase subunit B|uniref:V-type ATP synthase beta chain n=2 Tax=Meiothermus ruber TaxID=277 RepID=D3PQJ4_MEIRD|nr:V-type ATP synthase subunit B [Meiothermus ruber]ADD27727.1 H(+)-transporting two-sector ATPase [Meiothermus ruber DSM 1279]AGK04192.1 V-type ATP synthase subunit B [Meiothermus ruber DSM 1279]MCX7801633.1 V-type ATP synthase subunit B [Meiothermus ruber]GAO74655.1 A-type ATP synthase subunit B [Meiothermus ruber H328]
MLKKEYNAVTYVSGPLLFLEGAADLAYGAIVNIDDGTGRIRGGQVIEVSDQYTVLQVFEETSGLNLERTTVSLVEDVARLGVSKEMVGRAFNGIGKPIDGLPPVVADKRLPINGAPINPVAREKPEEFIQTGISAIDVNMTLVRGQKLPIFSGSGLPHNELAAQIARQAKVLGEGEGFAVVFAAMGITQREVSYFMQEFERTGALSRSVLFLNKADDPTVERLLTPRMALTAAEYLAFEHDYHVLVILTDMTNYCEALREIGGAREEIPGRRGYPGYMYTDLASLYERAGVVHGKKGSVTQIPILSMPGDDITHPIPDLTGYITEGQIFIARDLAQQGIFPPINVQPSLSRLMNNGIGKGKTRADHKELADQLFSSYARGVNLRRLVAITGEDALTEMDKKYLRFADNFEKKFINQGQKERSIEESLNIGWALLSDFPPSELKRIRREYIEQYHQKTGKLEELVGA